MPVSLSPPRPPITCLSIQLCISPQTEFTIFASFWNPQAWLRGAVVEIIQVCSFTFFRGLSFHNYLFQQCCRIRELIGITSVLSENHVFVQPLEIAIEILSFFFPNWCEYFKTNFLDQEHISHSFKKSRWWEILYGDISRERYMQINIIALKKNFNSRTRQPPTYLNHK